MRSLLYLHLVTSLGRDPVVSLHCQVAVSQHMGVKSVAQRHSQCDLAARGMAGARLDVNTKGIT